MPVSPPPSGDDSASGTRQRRAQGRVGLQKVNVACDRCRVKKIKCDGTTPCQSCQTISVDCKYSRTVRRYRGASIAKTQDLQRRLSNAERLLQSAGLVDQQEAFSSIEEDNEARILTDLQLVTCINDDVAAEASFRAGFSRHDNTSTSGINQLVDHSSTEVDHERASESEDVDCLPDDYGPLPDASGPPSRDEVHGPNSFASICADSGVAWIASRIGASKYATCATSFMSTISRKLKLQKRLSRQRLPDPPIELAWRYTIAYFDESIEATYQTIDRSDFEARLERHYTGSGYNDDPGWYALRNVVLACGCRITTFKSCTWMEVQTQAKGYFDNAISVEAELLHGTPGLIAIQALLIMAFFAEGLGSEKLEYTLIGCAIRLAYARGVHLQPSSRSVSFQQSERQSWLFWTLYCFEKHLTMRAGRPSVIDDDDISCALPTWAPNASSSFIGCFRNIVVQARMSSTIAGNFATVKARQRSLREKAYLIKEINTDLRSWYENLSPDLKIAFPVDTKKIPRDLRAEHLMYLHLSYHGNMAAIHSILGYPWNVNDAQFNDQDDTVVKSQIGASSDALAEASRNIILITRSISLDAVAPVWLVFYYPLLGMINMFVSILKSPTAAAIKKNVGFIDMAAGYFAYLDYSTDAIFSFDLVKNLAQWARQAVSQARDRVPTSQSTHFTVERDVLSPLENFYVNSFSNTGIDLDGMDLGDWPTFLPRLPQFTA